MTGTTATQRSQIRQILRSCPRLVAGGDLALVYTRNRIAEASWLCAHARASGVSVRLAPVAARAGAVARQVRAQVATPDTTCLVLADLAVTLPPEVLQLPGTETLPAVDLWRSPAVVAQRAQALADLLCTQWTLRRGATRLSVRNSDWAVEAATTAGAIEAEVLGADGVFVADGAIAVNRPVTWDARLAGRPVTLRVSQRSVTSVSCADPMLDRFLGRAVRVHRADRVGSVRVGAHPVACGFSAVAGPVNVRHPGITLRLHVDTGQREASGQSGHTAAADLRIDLTASWTRGATP